MSTLDRPSATIRVVASMPSTPGICTSMSTTSGRNSRHASIAAAPSAASPITSMSSSALSIIEKPERISG